MFRTLLAIAIAAGVITQSHAAGAQTASARSAKTAVVTNVNINTASASELEALPGIGPKTAERIVEYRQKNGPFKKVEELMNVRGVGEKNFLKLKPQITITTAKGEPRTANQQ
jgi:competence protein ComEA